MITPTKAYSNVSSINTAAILFATLGDPTRLRLLSRLRTTPNGISTRDLQKGAMITRQAINKHLERLAMRGLVLSRRIGRERMWYITPKAKELFRTLMLTDIL